MTTTINQLSEGLVRITRNNRDYLGLVTYIPAKPITIAGLTRQQKGDGWIIRGGEVTPWRVSGFTQHAERVYLYGEFVSARTLSEILRLEWENLLAYLVRLADAIRVAERNSLDIGPIHTRTVLFTDDGGVLFLPAELTRAIATQQNLTDRLEFTAAYTHPARDDRENRSFGLAVIAYRSLTGEYPFSASTEDELRDLMRASEPLPAYLRNPDIRPESSAILDRALRPEKPEYPEAGAWAEQFRTWRHEGVFRILTDEQRDEIRAQSLAREKKQNTGYRRREFWRKNWKKVVTIVLAVALVGTIPGTMIRNRLQPRTTAGFPPERVVEAFYTAINSFDHPVMEDAVVDGAGRNEIRMVTNLFVMSRMRMAVEMNTGFIDADEWRRDGDGSLPEGRIPWGTARLEIDPEQRTPDLAVFLVRYEMWMPADPGTGMEAPQGPLILGLYREERLFLRPERDDWVIYQIDRLMEQEIDLDLSALSS